MGIVKTARLVYEYIRRDEEEKIEEVKRAIDGVDLDIKKGSFVAVLGHNGSGKSTFAKHINGLLLPTDGTVWVGEMDTKDEEHIWDVRKTAGMVFQNPDNQIIGNIVEEDVGFGPENIGVETKEIWKRVDESLKAVGMTAYRKQSPNKLSGGQKQRVAIAGVMAMRPQCIILDEPTAMLDPTGRKDVIRTVHELNKKEGITVLLITHYMEEAIDADRVIVMDDGKVIMDGVPKEIFSRVKELKEHGLDVPQATELAYELKEAGMPLTDGILSREELAGQLMALFTDEKEENKMSIKAVDLNYVYGNGTAFEQHALFDVNFEIQDGEFVGIIGHTGSGKSTLIQHLNGLIKASSGALYYNGENIYKDKYDMKKLRSKVGLVFQYPEHQLFEIDVLTDVCFGPKNQGFSEEEAKEKAKKALSLVGLDESYYSQSPFELSGGQKRRVAIAGVLAMEPEVLILDEPTAGLDPRGRDEILDQIARLHTERKMTIILVSHSMEDVARYAGRLIVMNHGQKIFDGSPREVFSHYKELEAIGLAAPQVTYLVHDLKEKGLDIDNDITTVAEAKEAILALWDKKRKRQV